MSRGVVRLRPAARRDLDGFALWFRREVDAETAARFAAAAVATLHKLAASPGLGSPAEAKNPELVEAFRLFPNPMTHSARVELNAPGLHHFRFRLTDATGRLVRDRTVPSAFDVERADLAPGIYFYQITADAVHVATGRLVIL